MAFTPSKNKKRQNSACNCGTILAFSENQRQSTFHPRRKAPFLPPKTARTVGRSGQAGAEKRQAFLLLRRLRLLPLLKSARRRSSSAFAISATLPHVGATSSFELPVGTPPGCARKIGHSRDTRLTRADRPFSAAPVGTLPTAFGCVPAHTLRPALQAFARKTAGWRTEWAGAYTEGFRSACVHPV